MTVAIAGAVAIFGYTRLAAFLIVIMFRAPAPPGLPGEMEALTCSL
jgi:hypothetical protein